MKDYYAILGVSPNAETEVISAAYKSLAKKYHPDVYLGTQEEAEKRIRDINEAYSYLSNKIKKDKYDKELYKNKGGGSFDDFNDNEFDENLNYFDKDWDVLIEVFPNAEKLRLNLSKLSQKLGFLFQVVLLEKKMGGKAQQVSSNLKKEFLERYFGKNNKIQELATKALLNNEIEIAKEINTKITLLGDDAANKIYSILWQKLEKNIQLKKKKKSSNEPKFSEEKPYKTHKQSSSNKHNLKFIVAAPIFFLFIIAFLNSGHNSRFSSYNSNSDNIYDPCIIDPEKCSDSMLCEHAVYKDSDGSLYWNQWSEAHVDLAKERNLDCNVIKIKKNNLDNSTLNENVLSPYQKEACMENSVDCNDRFLCYFATEVVNGIVKWHSVAREYVNLAQNRNLNCDIGQSY